MSDMLNTMFILQGDALRDESIKSKMLREYRSDSTPVDTDPNIIINCRDSNEWTCLNEAYLEISGTSKGTGADLVGLNATACNIALEAGGASSLFATSRLRVANQLVESNDIYSHYTSFIRQLVNSCDDYTCSIAVGNSFVLDTTVNADAVPYTATFTTPAGVYGAGIITPVTVVPSDTYNSGFATRKALFGLTTGSRQRQTFYLPLRFLFDFCEVQKVMKAPLRIELVKRGLDEMVWGSGTTSFFSIDRCSLWLPIIQPSLKVLASLETKLSQGLSMPWSYNNWRTYASDSQVAGANRRYTFNSQAEKPTGAFLYCKVNKGATDQRSFNNFKFDHCDATNVQLLINGMRYPYTSYQPSWANGASQETGRVYAGLMEYLGKYKGEQDSGSLININNHRSLYPIYYFDFGNLDQLASNGGYQISVEMSCGEQANGMVMFLTVVSDTQWNIVGGEQGLQVIQA